MSDMDFPLWYSIGSYGGLVCALIAATSIAAYALLCHRGTPRQLARATLVCLLAGSLMLISVWWKQNRFDLYGPTLGALEVSFWLGWTAICGWCVPLGMLVGYGVLAAPLDTSLSGRMSIVVAPKDPDHSPLAASVHDPARRIKSLGSGQPWGQLTQLNGPFAEQSIALVHQVTLLGRELDNDIVIDDERTSRHHAQISWDHGRALLRDGNSMNGTLVNRQTVRGLVLLKSGDVLELGAQRYRFESLVSQPLSQAPSPPDAEAATDQDVEEHDTRKMPGASNGSDMLPPPPLALVGRSSVVADRRWVVSHALVTIGREPEREIYLPDESVSRLHAQIVRQRDGYFITDLRSSNGTFLNGQQLTAPALLTPGALLRIGEVELLCEPLTGASEPSVPKRDAIVVHNGSIAHGHPHASSNSTTQAFDRHSLQSSVDQAEHAEQAEALLLLQRVDAARLEDHPRLEPLPLTPSQPHPSGQPAPRTDLADAQGSAQ